MDIPSRITFDYLIRTEILLWNRCDAVMRRHLGVPLSHIEALRVIAPLQSCRVHDLASGLLITVGAASKLVDRLEAAGTVRRTPNPDDRRSSLLEVTDAGRSVLGRSDTLMEETLAPVFAPADLKALTAALAAVERAVRELPT